MCTTWKTKKRASDITIAFEKQPDGVVTIVDHKVSWWMLARDMNGVTEGSRRIANEELQENHTHIFGIDSNVLTFELWEYFGLHAMSDPPILRGLQIQCAFDGVPVEYYILLYYGLSYMEDYYPEVVGCCTRWRIKGDQNPFLKAEPVKDCIRYAAEEFLQHKNAVFVC